MRFYKNKLIKKCKECPFFFMEVDVIEDVNGKKHECNICYCLPFKDKHGCNSINEEDTPHGKWFCRLHNEVTEEYVFEFGAFVGETVGNVARIAPKYLKALVEKGAFKIVRELSPNY